MISIAELVKRHQLASLQDRIRENDDALDLARGLWTPRDNELLPAPINTSRRRAWDRALRQMQSLGPRVIETKVNAIIGDITWGGEDDNLDELLDALDIRGLASNLLTSYIATGVAAAYVYEGDDGTPRVTRLGGYVEPYTDPDDVDRVVGLFQAWQVVREHKTTSTNAFSDTAQARTVGKWMVRVYDWSESPEGECVMRQWDDLHAPYALAGSPASELVIPRPRFILRNLSQEGLPVGELVACMPQFKALWATEARMTTSEEMSAFPMMKALGDVDAEDFTVGPSEIVTGAKDAVVEWMSPGSLQELREQRLLRIERLTADLALPTSFGTTQAVSAESARERNIQFRQNTAGYARDLTKLLSDLVGNDYVLALGGREPIEVAVLPSMEYDEVQRTQNVVTLYREGLIPLRVAAGAVQAFFPTWSDEDFNTFVEEQTSTVTISDFGVDDTLPPEGQ